MDYIWLVVVIMYMINLILVLKINWWFVFIIFICGWRECSKKNYFMYLCIVIYENWNNIIFFIKNNY